MKKGIIRIVTGAASVIVADLTTLSIIGAISSMNKSVGIDAVLCMASAILLLVCSLYLFYCIGEGQEALDEKYRKDDDDGGEKLQTCVVRPDEAGQKQECADTPETQQAFNR